MSSNNLPLFPDCSHKRFILAMLIQQKGIAVKDQDCCNQFLYQKLSHFVNTDFRTRINELGRELGWQIDRAFIRAVDQFDMPVRCKCYWLNDAWLSGLYSKYPDFQARCELLVEKELYQRSERAME
ncbi:MAG: hypothetical protein CMI12_15380 [Oceanospirillum sp.]|nr:hypothetical protein [Oceanospirillum sp.]